MHERQFQGMNNIPAAEKEKKELFLFEKELSYSFLEKKDI